MAPTRDPVSRRERPAKPALTRDGIVSVALDVMRREGLTRVTMRRLAVELDTGPASLYVYVASTAELHALLLDEVLGELDLARPAPGWRESIADMMYRYIALLMAYPGLAASALVARPAGPGYLGLLDALLGLLGEGMPAGRAAWAVDLALHWATATAAEQGTRDRAVEGEDEDQRLMAALRATPAEIHPHIAAVRDELSSGDGESRFRWQIAVLLTGMTEEALPGETRPAPKREERRAEARPPRGSKS